MAYQIKDLEFVGRGGCRTAMVLGGTYDITHNEDESIWWWSAPLDPFIECGSLAEAVSHCNQHWQSAAGVGRFLKHTG